MPFTRDIVASRRSKPTPQRPHTTINIDIAAPQAGRAPARDAVTDVVSTMKAFSRGLEHLRTSEARIQDGLACLASVAEARRATKDAEAREQARVDRGRPAFVQAANVARWGRSV